MNPISDDLAALAAGITAAGVPATADPGMVLQLVASHPAVAVVGPPEELTWPMGAAHAAYAAPVWVVTAGPDDAAALDRILTAALVARAAAPPAGPMTRDTLTAGEVDLPAFRWVTTRRTPIP